MKISENQIKALRKVCDVFIPSIVGSEYWERKASDLKVAERMIEQVSALSEREQREFRQLLSLLSKPILGLTWRGPFKPVYKLSDQEIQKLLNKWSRSRLSDIRKSFNTLKKLCGLIYFGGTQSGTNQNWEDLDYQQLPKPKESPDLLSESILMIKEGQELSCDVCIVGSGAGGAVAAAVLASAGLKVIIVEKGPYLKPKDFNQEELDMFNKLYEGKGLLTTVDGGVSILAGSCLGGGTTVNWAGAFRTPDYILKEWADGHGNPHFLSTDYSKGFDFVEKRTRISTELIKHNPQNETLFSGAKKLNWETKIIPRNVKNVNGLSKDLFWKSQGFSPLGDSYETKKSAPISFLVDAVKKEAQILYNTTATKVLHQNGVAQGVSIITNINGKEVTTSIKAKQVVIAAGSIHSPAILKRSNLHHKEIGRNLYLHPTVPIAAFYEQPSYPWYGPMMSAVVDEFTQVDGNFGFKIETAPVHPGLSAAVANWQNGQQFKQDMLDTRFAQNFIVLTRDKYGGRIKLDKKGQPLIHYRLHDYDKKHLIQGMQKAVEIHHVSDAQKIQVFHNQPLIFEKGRDDFNFLLNEIPRRKWNQNYFSLFSAHQMGTCRMGGDAKKHPVTPTGETREIKNLFVADGSLFPSASGANPMLSIQALAYYVANNIAAGV